MDKVIIEKKMPKRQRLSLERKLNYYGYLFVLPIILGYVLLYLPVLIESIIYSFSSVKFVPGQGGVSEWIGIQNYKDAFANNEGEFPRLVISTVLGLIPQVIVILIFSFFVATVLNQNFRGRTIARVIFFIPVIVSTGIITYFENLTSMVTTYRNQEKLDMGQNAYSAMETFSSVGNVFQEAIGNDAVFSVIWGAIEGIYSVLTSAGIQMLVFLSGLQSISPNMYEAAKVEGATGWEIFWKISFPMISPLILVNLIYTVIDLFLRADNQAVAYIHKALDSTSRYAEASALSWIYTIVVLAFVGISFLIIKKLVVYQD